MDTEKPLRPLDSGVILLVGVKASNFDDEIRNHPRVVMWDSQQQSWTDKELPSNTRAVFITRFIGHAAFKNILKETRKKHITMFNPEGTGKIARQVKELLALNMPKTDMVQDMNVTKDEEISEMTPVKVKSTGKLDPLIPFIDWDKGPTDNARDILEAKAKELGIKTTFGSLTQFVHVQNKKRGKTSPTSRNTHSKVRQVESDGLDVSLQVLDNVISELKDVRDYLVQTVKENDKLKLKLAKFRKFFED